MPRFPRRDHLRRDRGAAQRGLDDGRARAPAAGGLPGLQVGQGQGSAPLLGTAGPTPSLPWVYKLKIKSTWNQWEQITKPFPSPRGWMLWEEASFELAVLCSIAAPVLLKLVMGAGVFGCVL